MSNALLREVPVRPDRLRAVAFFGVLLLAQGCADFGDGLRPGLAGGAPAIAELVPFRTFPGDTVQLIGSGFGTTPGRVVFTSTGLRAVVDATVVTWEDDRIVVLSPEGAGDGPVRVQVGELISQAADFATAPPRSYAGDIVPLLDYVFLGGHDCVTCHYPEAPSGGLAVTPYASLLAGSSIDGRVVIPRRSVASRLVQRLLPSTPEPLRMPQAGSNVPYMTDAEIQVISDWIDQGAPNN